MNIPYGRQDIDASDIEAVVSTLQSDFLTQGPKVGRFEQDVAQYSQSAHAIAFNSATSALHAACLALGVGEGDRVWTTPITFVASANCALYCQATVDFVDIDARTFNMSVEALSTKLVEAKKRDQLPKVVIVVHMTGLPCEMAEVRKLSREYGFKVIEDASHAIGARYRQSPIGRCEFSDITVFSFHPVKLMTTGEGGLATTQDAALAQSLRLFCSHGITRDTSLMKNAPDGPWYYEQIALGYNYRMTDLQAALGSSQLKRLDQFVQKRNQLARVYNQEFESLDLQLPIFSEDKLSSFHLYVLRLPERRGEVFEALRANGLGVNVHYIPVYKQPYYQNLGFARDYCVEAERYYDQAITLPLFSRMTESEQNYVIEMFKKVWAK